MIYLDSNDKRLLFLKEIFNEKKIILEQKDFDLILKEAKNFDTIILSPAFKWNLEKATKLHNNLTVVCGNVDNQILESFKQKNIKYYNLMANETFVLKNAILTAEGFLSDLISNTNSSIYDQKILILGGGRVAKALGLLFFKLGVNFDITMRNENKLLDFQLYTTNIVFFDTYKKQIKNYDVIINTIPTTLFTKEDLKYFKNNQKIFELASKKVFEEDLLTSFYNNQYKISFEENNKKEKSLDNNLENKYINFILCPALPAKYTPKSAGKLIYEYLLLNKII